MLEPFGEVGELVARGPKGSECLKLGEEMAGGSRISKDEGTMVKFSVDILIRSQRTMDMCHSYSS